MKNVIIPTLLLAVSLLLLNFSWCGTNRKTAKMQLTQTEKTFVAVADTPDTGVIPVVTGEPLNYIAHAKDSVVSVTISFVGDLMCHLPQTKNAKCAAGYDFNPCYEYVKPYLESADVTIGNLELTTAGTRMPYAGYPAFNAPDEYITALKETGFDFLVTSNNHSMDTGEEGLLRTIRQIKKRNIGYTGTFLSQQDHDSIRLINTKGITLAILNYTYGTNGAYPSSDHKYMLNVIDSASIFAEVAKAKQLKPDFILVFYHYGVEYKAEPIESQKKAVRWARDAGATIVIGAHPHVVGPCRWLTPDAEHKDSCFVAWSLGNFFSNQPNRYNDAGVILIMELSKNVTRDKAYFGSASFLPTWVYRGDKPQKKKHIIFPAALFAKPDQIPTYLDSALVNKMKQAFGDTKDIINKYGPAATLKTLKP